MSARSDFFDALAEGDFAVATDLMQKHGFGPKTKDWTRFRRSPLAYATKADNREFAADLIARGADVNEMVAGETPLVMMASSAETAELLVKAGANIEAKLKRDASNVNVVKGATALIKAAHDNNEALVTKLIELGADVKATDRLGRTALHYAAHHDGRIADRLIAAGADFMAKDRFGRPALFKAPTQANSQEAAAQSVENSISPIQGLGETSAAINAALASNQQVADIAARRDILETNYGLTAVPKDALSKFEAADLALQDAAAFRTIQSHSEKLEAAYAIENNMQQQANYRAALIEQAPDVAKDLGHVFAQEQRMVAEKDARKSLEAQSMLQDHLQGYEHAVGKRITVPHGEFHFLEGGDALGDDARYGVVPRTIDKPVIRFRSEDELGKYLAEQNIDEADRRAIDAFYSLSRLQDRARHLEVQIAPENSIIAIERSVPQEAINLEEYISRLETGKDNGLDLDAGTEGGPSTLLRGRFIRDEAGQYRRIGEERIALVDEGDKIRFVDKQFDTFQAATELASAKQWQAIQVTGTDKFRAEAWFAARLAGLEVVGYEPKEKDLERLEQAVRKGLAHSHSEPSPEVAASRTKAEDFALSAGKGLQGVSTDGSYKGKIVHETDHHVVQDVGRNVAVVHEKAGLEAERLQQARAGDKSIRVQYSKGRASIAPEREQSREAALSR